MKFKNTLELREPKYVTSYTEVWIEIMMENGSFIVRGVTSYTEVWIEIDPTGFRRKIGAIASPPIRRCGLKLGTMKKQTHIMVSPPIRRCGLK